MPLSKKRDRIRKQLARLEIKRVQPKHGVDLSIPVYNSNIHSPGDRVLVAKEGRLVEAIVPDADGNIIY